MDKFPSNLLCFLLHNCLPKNGKACGFTFANSHVLSQIEKCNKLRMVYVAFLPTLSKKYVLTAMYKSFSYLKPLILTHRN